MPELFATALPPSTWWAWLTPWAVLLWLAACVGHTVLHVYWLNRLYAIPLPRRVLKLARRVNSAVILSAPLLFTLLFAAQPDWSEPTLAVGYTWLCWLCGVVLGPLATLRYRLRPRPAALLAESGTVIDIAAQLGYVPTAHGKLSHFLTSLPLNDIYQVELSERRLHLPQLPPAWEGLTILHLSDLHFHGTPDRIFYDKVFEHCRGWEPDILALTGDLVDSSTHYRWIVPILGKLRWRSAAFAILGNHDSWRDDKRVRRRLQRLGMHVLGNRWMQAEVRGLPLLVVGHEGPWFLPEPSLRGCPTDLFRLCLSHTPDNIAWARRHAIDLMLSGHNHGGQVRFPLIGSVFVPSRYSRWYDCGTFSEPPTLLHVSRGLAGKFPIRFRCRPEVTLLTLTRNPT